jgi:hypothetical protein
MAKRDDDLMAAADRVLEAAEEWLMVLALSVRPVTIVPMPEQRAAARANLIAAILDLAAKAENRPGSRLGGDGGA